MIHLSESTDADRNYGADCLSTALGGFSSIASTLSSTVARLNDEPSGRVARGQHLRAPAKIAVACAWHRRLDFCFGSVPTFPARQIVSGSAPKGISKPAADTSAMDHKQARVGRAYWLTLPILTAL
jgi:hypothetical protein